VPDSQAADSLIKKEPQVLAQDPIVGRSTSGIILVSVLLLMVSLVWSLYDETYLQRPWKGMQREFVARYTRYLKGLKDGARQSETHAPYQDLGKKPDQERGKKVRDNGRSGKEAECSSHQRDAHSEEEIVETFQEPKALLVHAFCCALRQPTQGKSAQPVNLGLSDDSLGNRSLKVLVLHHHNVSTVRFRLV